MDPSENGGQAASGAGQPAGSGAGASEQQPQTPPANPGNPSEPDYKSLYEESEKRRKGLDKRLSQLRRGSQQDGIDPNLPEDQRTQAELDSLRLYKAENQLKLEATEILDRYPKIPKGLRNAIIKNPRGFINSTTQTVEDAILDLEEYIANANEEVEVGETPTVPNDPKQVRIASQNATVNAPGKPDLDHMSPEEVDAAIEAGIITEKDLEAHVKAKADARRNSK